MIFWTLFIALILLWYVLITALVTVRGGKDIKRMLNQLEKKQENGPKI